MATNVTFAYRNWLMPSVSHTPSVTVPGGAGWIDTGKLTGEVLSEMARCPSLDLANTQMTWDMGTTRALRCFGMPMHNGVVGDKVRVSVAADAGFAEVSYDTGWQEVIGQWYPFGAVPWGDPHWWDGLPSAEDLDGYCPPWTHTAPEDVTGRYVKWEWDVSGNPAGYLDVGRLWVAPIIRPRYNMNYGVKIGHADKSQVARNRGAVVFGDEVEKFRTVALQLDWLSVEEAFGQMFEMQRLVGVTQPFLFIYDGDDVTAMRTRRSFPVRFASLDEIDHPSFSRYAVAAKLEEYK